MVKVALASDPKGIKEFERFSQGTEDCQNLRYGSLVILF